MEQLNFFTIEQLTRFFHYQKTEMSSIEEPHTFLNQLRDHNLIPEDKYKKVIRAKSRHIREKGMYELLDLLEKQPDKILPFWKCVFKDHVLQQYPLLRVMKNNLFDGSFVEMLRENENMGEKYGKEGERMKRKEVTKTGVDKIGEGRKADNQRVHGAMESAEGEEPGPSSQATPIKRPRKSRHCPSEKEDIWNWPMYKICLPVTCGDKEGILYRNKLARGERCILVEGRRFSPIEFEEFAGKKSCKNWKTSIRFQGTTLKWLIEKGHLECEKLKRRDAWQDQESDRESSLGDRPSFSNRAEVSISGLDSETREAAQEIAEEDLSSFAGDCLPVTCGSARGTLRKDRFASGTVGKCIRTEDKWLTPVDFLKEDRTSSSLPWMRGILCLGKPLIYLLEMKVLIFHALLCECGLCSDQALEQDKDDDCFICDSPDHLMHCDQCPRAFHHECHLPAVNENTVGDKWICTYCVLKMSQPLPQQMTLQMVLQKPVSDHPLHCQYLLMCLYKEDKLHVFKNDPGYIVSDCNKIISHPMWLDKIADRLKYNNYSRVGQFFSDVQLIFQNCAMFNQDNFFGRLGTKLKNLFEEEFRKVFFIQL